MRVSARLMVEEGGHTLASSTVTLDTTAGKAHAGELVRSASMDVMQDVEAQLERDQPAVAGEEPAVATGQPRSLDRPE